MRIHLLQLLPETTGHLQASNKVKQTPEGAMLQDMYYKIQKGQMTMQKVMCTCSVTSQRQLGSQHGNPVQCSSRRALLEAESC